MQKRGAFQKNCIAMLLAVMLMFCAFADGNDNAGCMAERAGAKPGSMTLACPGAGEFFTDSLPQTEPHSVKEALTHWQDLMGPLGQGGRIQRSGSTGGRHHLWMLFETTVLQQMAEGFGRKDFIKEKTVHHSSEIIVCYIHNKDGQKG